MYLTSTRENPILSCSQENLYFEYKRESIREGNESIDEKRLGNIKVVKAVEPRLL